MLRIWETEERLAERKLSEETRTRKATREKLNKRAALADITLNHLMETDGEITISEMRNVLGLANAMLDSAV